MAEIEIERRPRRSPWTWVALALVLIAVAIGAWLVFGGVEQGAVEDVDIEVPMTEPLGPTEDPPGSPTDDTEEDAVVDTTQERPIPEPAG